jgi:hypothetical protein
MDHLNYIGTTKLVVPDPIDYRLNRKFPHSKTSTAFWHKKDLQIHAALTLALSAISRSYFP